MNMETIRHSLSHILASAVLQMFPEAKLGIGPAIENGFYYDFDLPRNLVPEDLKKIEKTMKKIIKDDFLFEKREEDKVQTIQHLEEIFQKYKAELAQEIQDPTLSFYDTKHNKRGHVVFSDMCAGPHVESTKDLRAVGFTLDKVSGAYWRGDEKRPMLQRIYGLAFETKEALETFIAQRIEAEKRNHRKLGKSLDLFVFSEKVGPGLPLFTPKGTIIIEELKKRVEKICRQFGFQKVMTPHLAKIDLYQLSGHATKFADELFHVTSTKGHAMVMKPVQCPHQTQIYASRPRSYRDLPIRYMESEKQYRAEKSGEIGGLTRVYAITVEDGHAFCRVDQVKQEAMNMVKIIRDFYTDLGMWGNHWVSLSVRDYANPDKYIGDPGDWDVCEAMLAEISEEMGLHAKRCEGEAALYGPKLDFMFKDAMGREVQIPTVQLDFATPKRFDLTYINEEGKPVPPVMVHRAILGSYERFLALLIEHFAGAFPVWLAPVQVKILPIADRHHEYAKTVFDGFNKEDIRVELDDRSESIGKKIREAEMQKIPYMLVIGDKEVESANVSVRSYQDGDMGQLGVDELIQKIRS
ncbi:MAG: threonine--tRNA ligase [Proteobacteria bacterium]|nr:threonine--tRNA ligase [Pseudomonadota bacterium]MBU4472382.1 threonine--tRNA ligase [Pseudomonadota bacterium]MCG2752078.1 threonine--tRNA ligase [Desulfobacteraceae bacterium]